MPAPLLSYFSQCVTSCSAKRGQDSMLLLSIGRPALPISFRNIFFNAHLFLSILSHQQPAPSNAEDAWNSLHTLSSQSTLALPLHPKMMNKVCFATITILTGLAMS